MLFSTRAEFLLNTVRVQIEYIMATSLLSVAKLLKNTKIDRRDLYQSATILRLIYASYVE